MAKELEKKEQAKKVAKKERKFHPVRYFREVLGELKRLTWLSKKDLLNHSVAVFVFVIAMALVIYVLDLAFGGIMKVLGSISIG